MTSMVQDGTVTDRGFQAAIFDTDGVVTRTASAHFAAWKSLFDGYLASHGSGDQARPFTDDDYRRHVDGVARYDGVARFLTSRGIEPAWGDPADAPGDTTVCALGNAKDAAFVARVRDQGVRAFTTTVRFVEALREAGVATAVISASRNCEEVLAAAGVEHLFDVRVDGIDADRLGLPGKPDPAIFVEAARRLGVAVADAVVVEDAVAGVEAGRRGSFGLVVGVDRTAHPEALALHADIVVPDLADLEVDARTGSLARRDRPAARITDLVDALDDPDVARRTEDRRPAVFLDYDGTLTPIVERPDMAVLATETRAVLERLARHCPVGIISGRDLDDVRAMVDAEGLWYAGSHGFDIWSPAGERHQVPAGRDALPALRAAEAELSRRVQAIPNAWVEGKQFAVAVHDRQTPDEHLGALEAIVREVAALHPDLRLTGGKRIHELRPAVDWDKGRALLEVLETAGAGAARAGTSSGVGAVDDLAGTLAVYLGDDETDEDAFLAIRSDGLGVVVADEDRPTAAHARLADPAGVHRFLCWLLERIESEAT